MKRALLPCLILLTVAPTLSAGTEVLLKDGQVFDAIGVRRAGDVYLVELESGATLTLPVDLIAQVRLSDERDEDETERVEGLSYGEPQQLAGSPVEPLAPADAQAVFGEPSTFRKGIINPNWRPESGFPEGDVLDGSRSTWSQSIFDPIWRPRSGFPEGDVLSRNRTTWREAIIANTWTPEDGFAKKNAFWEPTAATQPSRQPVAPTGTRKLAPTEAPSREPGVAEPASWFDKLSSTRSRPGVHFEFKLPVTAKAPSESIRACARRVLPSAPADPEPRIEVREVDDPRYAGLPVDVYAAAGESAERSSRVLFTIQGGTCRAIGGDLRDTLGVELDRSSRLKSGIGAYNAALDGGRGVVLRTDEDKIDYAFAVVSLVDPALGGAEALPFVLLDDPASLELLAATEPVACSVAEAKREKAGRQALRRFVEPRVVEDAGRETIELLTWSGSEGQIVRHRVLVAARGNVSIERETIATHVGAHLDRN